MKLQVNFRLLAALGWMIPVSAPVLAQPAVSGQDAPAEVRKPTRGEGYLDGDAWVRVRRGALRPDGLRAAVVDHGGRTFPAALGADALVRLAADAPAADVWSRHGAVRAVIVSPRLRLFRMRGRTGEDGLDVATRLAESPWVAAVMPDLYVRRRPAAIAVPPNDPRYSAQWYLAQLQIERAWKHTTGNRSTAVVVVDGGCDMDHPDLVGNMVGGIDLVDGDDDPEPLPGVAGNEHGTACAGIIAATGDNGVGIAGVCPECSLHCVRLYGQGDKALVPLSADIAAFEYAFDVGAAVVSNSWGFADPMPVPRLLRTAIESLIDDGRDGRGTLVVFAAGNENRRLDDDELVAIDGVINVGAINNFDEAAPFSNFGPSVDVTAPTGTFTTDIAGADGQDPGDYTDLFGGTSSACPVVAGVAALVFSAEPELSARQAGALLVATARSAPYAVTDAAGHDPIYGFGIADPLAAVRAALGMPESPPDAGPPTGERRAEPGEDTGRRSSCSLATSPGRDARRAWPQLVVVLVALCLVRLVRRHAGR